MAGVFTLKHCSLVGQDATGTPIDVNLAPGPGDFSISGLEHNLTEALPVYNRGTYYEAVEGSDKGVEFSLTVYHEGALVDGGTDTVMNMVMKQGTFSAGTTTDAGGVVWMVDIVFTATRSGVTSTITLNNCRVMVSYTEDANGNQLQISGTAYGTGTTSRPVVIA